MRTPLLPLVLTLLLGSLPLTTTSQEVYQTLDWVDLLPQHDLDALLNPPEFLQDIEDGSPEDQISSAIADAIGNAADSAYQQALISTDVKSEFNNQKVRIPGFVVPLEFNEKEAVTSFFLVPYFGACIHVPPPPPNQIVFVSYQNGLPLDSLYNPYWIEGVLKTELVENDLATSAYALTAEQIELYQETN